MKVLIVEDEKTLAYELEAFLKKSFYLCDLAHSVKAAKEQLDLNQYDFVLIDLSLPDGDGLEVLKEAKQSQPNAAYIILTARSNLKDRVAGLDLGADDYLAKPFYLLELQSRMQAISRRKFGVTEELLAIGQFKSGSETYRVFMKIKAINSQQLVHEISFAKE